MSTGVKYVQLSSVSCVRIVFLSNSQNKSFSNYKFVFAALRTFSEWTFTQWRAQDFSKSVQNIFRIFSLKKMVFRALLKPYKEKPKCLFEQFLGNRCKKVPKGEPFGT